MPEYDHWTGSQPDYELDGKGSRLIGERRFYADLEVLHMEIRMGRAGLAAWWAMTAMRDARACGLWKDEPQPVRKQSAA